MTGTTIEIKTWYIKILFDNIVILMRAFSVSSDASWMSVRFRIGTDEKSCFKVSDTSLTERNLHKSVETIEALFIFLRFYYFILILYFIKMFYWTDRNSSLGKFNPIFTGPLLNFVRFYLFHLSVVTATRRTPLPFHLSAPPPRAPGVKDLTILTRWNETRQIILILYTAFCYK